MKKILLLGGNGYVGSKFYQNCATKYQITSVDLCMFGQDLGYSIKQNYRDFLENIKDFEVIICLAGHSSVQMCTYSSDRSWINNVDYFRSLCSKLSNDQLLIYASSASVYGVGQNISTENTAIAFDTVNDYDLQKITIDLIANRYIGNGKNIIGLRFGTVNGASPNTRRELMLNSMTISALETGQIRIKNLSIRRAILGINDLSNCLECCINYSLKPGQYNLSSFNSTVDALSKTVSSLTGAEIIRLPDDSTAYDFAMSTDKFVSYTYYKFTDTVESLVRDLIDQNQSCVMDTRFNDQNFSQYL